MEEGTPQLPFGTIFQSNEWLDEPEGDVEVGEVPGAPRTWVDGSEPFPVAGTGPPCGTADQFARGALIADAGAPLNVYGDVACCPTPPAPFVHNACIRCPDGAYSDYLLTTRGIGPLPLARPFNGTFRLTYVGSCSWRSAVLPWTTNPPHTFFYEMGMGSVDLGVGLNTDEGGNVFQWYLPDKNWDCLTEKTVPVALVVPPLTGTIAVALNPGITTLPSPNACPALGAATSPVYYVIVPDVISTGAAYKLTPGTYALLQSDRCQWVGQLTARRFIPTPVRLPVPAVLDVLADGTPILTVSPNLFAVAVHPVQFTGLAGWSGAADAGLIRGFTPLGSLTYPVAVTLAVPVLP